MNTLTAIITGATCGDACWHAVEETCRCSCGGANHGILNGGGKQPDRTGKIGGEFFELVAVVPHLPTDSCPAVFFERVRQTLREVTADRFPGIDSNGYGPYCLGKTYPVLDRKISPSQAKWPEVQAVPGAQRLIWARPKGSRYVVRGPDYTSHWNT